LRWNWRALSAAGLACSWRDAGPKTEADLNWPSAELASFQTFASVQSTCALIAPAHQRFGDTFE
jgi:hypothetical protein